MYDAQGSHIQVHDYIILLDGIKDAFYQQVKEWPNGRYQIESLITIQTTEYVGIVPKKNGKMLFVSPRFVMKIEPVHKPGVFTFTELMDRLNKPKGAR